MSSTYLQPMLRLLKSRNFSAVGYRWPEAAAMLGYVVISVLGVLRHEMWRDELQAWMLARDSASVSELISNMMTEGHPALWHLCLYVLSRLTQNPVPMQLFHWLLSAGTAYLLIYHSPFRRMHRLLLPFGYFFCFEYTIISRSYGLGVFLLMLFCHIYRQNRQQFLKLSFLLACVANVSAYSLVLSALLFSLIAIEALKDRVLFRPARNLFIVGALIFSLGMAVSSLQIYAYPIHRMSLTPQALELESKPDVQFDQSTAQDTANGSSGSELAQIDSADAKPSNSPPASIKSIGRGLVGIWETYFPIPQVHQISFWNTNLFVYDSYSGRITEKLSDTLKHIALLISVIIFCIFGYAIAGDRLLLLGYLFSTLAFVGVYAFIHHSLDLRHQGHIFLALIVCLWLLEVRAKDMPQKPARKNKRLANRIKVSLFSTILIAQAAAGAYALGMDYVYPFSTGKKAAEFIASSDYSDVDIIGIPYKNVSVLSGYLGRPIFYPEFGREGSFWGLSLGKKVAETTLGSEVAQKLNRLPERQALLAVAPADLDSGFFSQLDSSGVNTTLLRDFSPSIVADEELSLFLVELETS